MTYLTDKQIKLLKQILIDEGCMCAEEHDEIEDAMGLNCLAGIALMEVEASRLVLRNLRDRLELAGDFALDTGGFGLK